MSRIGRLPITIPAGVTVSVSDDNTVTVKGPKGELKEKFSADMKVELEDGTVKVSRPSDDKKHRALHGLTRALLHNMVVGVTDGFEVSLDLVGVGYRAQKDGRNLNLSVGFTHPVVIVAEDGIEFDVPAANKVIVKGSSKQRVGQIAADIRKIRPPEPYLGKGIRYTNETVLRKEGKTGK